MKTSNNGLSTEFDAMSNVGKSAHLKNDPALKAFLSKEIKNDSAVFHDYPPTKALVHAAIIDVMNILGIKTK